MSLKIFRHVLYKYNLNYYKAYQKVSFFLIYKSRLHPFADSPFRDVINLYFHSAIVLSEGLGWSVDTHQIIGSYLQINALSSWAILDHKLTNYSLENKNTTWNVKSWHDWNKEYTAFQLDSNNCKFCCFQTFLKVNKSVILKLVFPTFSPSFCL